MITLDTDMYLLCSLFNVSQRKIADEYSGMSVEDIMEAEAAQGNASAANFDKAILNDPVKLIELFKLNDVGNKYAILSNLNEKDLEELLPMLDQEDLVAGLNLFTKDKLLKLSEQLPMEQLVNMVFQMFAPEELMQFMPEDQLNKFLTSTELDKDTILKNLQSMNPQILAQMLEATTGQPAMSSDSQMSLSGQVNYDGQQILQQLMSLPDDKFQESLLNMPTQAKKGFILTMAKQDNKLFQLFDASAYTSIMGQKRQKEDIVKSSMVLESDQLVKMLEELPQDLTAIVLTQIDTNKFADVLLSKFKDIIKEIVAG